MNKTRMNGWSAPLGALMVALAAAGCGGGGGSSTCARIQAEWTILQTNTTTPLTCDQAGAASVVIHAGGLTSPPIPCSSFSGISPALATGSYDVSLDLLDAGGNVIDSSGSMTVTLRSCGTSDVTASTGPVVFQVAPACPPNGIDVVWTIEQIATSQPLTCGDVPATTVTIDVGSMSQDFPCTDGALTTDALPAGTYQVSLTLSDNGTVLSQTPPMNITVPACGVIAAPDVVFDVN
jgi:hypothetical protein